MGQGQMAVVIDSNDDRFVGKFPLQRLGHVRQIASVNAAIIANPCDCDRLPARRGVALANDQRWGLRERTHGAKNRKAAFLAAILCGPLGAIGAKRLDRQVLPVSIQAWQLG
jgi:hypothetical protein